MTKDHQEDDTAGTSSSTSWNTSEGSAAMDDSSSAVIDDRSTVFEQKKPSTIPKAVENFNGTDATSLVEYCNNRSAAAVTNEKLQYIDNVLQINSATTVTTTAAAEKFDSRSSDECTSKAQYINSVVQNNGNAVTEKNNFDTNGRVQNDLLSKHNILHSLQSTEQFSHNVDNRMNGGDDFGRTDPNRNLIVAIRVGDCNSSDECFLPAAIEFDPDKKNATTDATGRKRCRKILISTFLVVIIGISLTIGLIFGMKKRKRIQHPRLQVGILQYLEKQFPTNAHECQDPTTPFAKAMNWMTFDDPQLLVPSQNKTFLQRFILVHLYFQTTQNNNWAYCYPNGTTANGKTTILYDTTNTSIIYDRCFSFTLSKYEGLIRQKPSPKLWLSSQDVCDWASNRCDSSGHITTVGAVGLGLNGPFPDKINRLSFLRKVEIAANNLTGTIPENIHFKYATEMFSGNNQFDGEFPIQFLQESRLLYRYFFFFNQFTELNVNHWPTDMKQVMFEGSTFSQALLDTHIERVPSLSHIDFTNTNVQGKIPVSLWNLPYINTIELTQNFLTGQLPQQRLPRYLEFIQLERNQITGPIPEEILESSLFRLSLSDNKLEGTIPNNISNLERVYDLSLDKNEGLYGTIPTEFGKLRNLLEVTFDGTSLNGTVPIELCYLRDGRLEKLRSDCLLDTITGIAPISCADDCCTSCCDSNGSSCIDYV